MVRTLELKDPDGTELTDILGRIREIDDSMKSKLSEEYFSRINGEYKGPNFMRKINRLVEHFGEDRDYINGLEVRGLGIRYSDMGGKRGIADLKLAILEFYEEQLRNQESKHQ